MFKKIILSLTVVFSGFCFAENVSVFGHNENVSTDLVQKQYHVASEIDDNELPKDPTSAFGLDFHDPKLKKERSFEKHLVRRNNILDSRVSFMLNEKKEVASLYLSYVTNNYIQAENNFEVLENALTKKYKVHKNTSFVKANYNNGVVGHINRRFESKNYIIKLSFYQKPKYFYVEVYYLLKSEVDRLERKLLDDI
jgi:hypothetical protein